jgi:hypothetical protein
VRWSSRSTAVDRLGVKKMKNKVGWKAGRTVRREVKAGLRCRSAASSTLSKSAEARTDIRFLRGRHDDRELKESMNPSLDIIYRETERREKPKGKHGVTSEKPSFGPYRHRHRRGRHLTRRTHL